MNMAPILLFVISIFWETAKGIFYYHLVNYIEYVPHKERGFVYDTLGVVLPWMVVIQIITVISIIYKFFT